MKLYRFSPIKSHDELLEAIRYTHLACHKLCRRSLNEYLPVAGNVGIFSHYDDEYSLLTKLREELTEASDSFNQKYFRLHEPILISPQENIPATTYTYLYIRHPDPYRSQVGDVDFYLKEKEYAELKQSLLDDKKIKGARLFERSDLDMIEIFDPDIDALGFVATHKMTEKVKTKS